MTVLRPLVHMYVHVRYLAVETSGVRPGPHTDELAIVKCCDVSMYPAPVPQSTCDGFGMIVELCVHVFCDLKVGCV